MADSITPPPKLVEQWFTEQRGLSEASRQHIATRAAQWGADQELEACVEWLASKIMSERKYPDLRAARRPEPMSLKEQALKALDDISIASFEQDAASTIRQALESLPD
jgi:hypothetical protein